MTGLQMRAPPVPRTCCRFQGDGRRGRSGVPRRRRLRGAASVATATVHGVVRDASDAVLANATITLTRVDTGQSRPPARSDRDGAFRFLALSPGHYRLSVALAGFAPAERTFELTVDLDFELPLTLNIARKRVGERPCDGIAAGRAVQDLARRHHHTEGPRRDAAS